MPELKSLAKALHEPHAAEVSQVAFIKRENDFSGAFGHLPQSTLLGAFVSRAKKCASAAIFQAVSGIHDHSSRILEVQVSIDLLTWADVGDAFVAPGVDWTRYIDVESYARRYYRLVLEP